MALPDPNPAMSADEVMDFYSGSYTELTTATVHGPEIENDRVVYHFKTTIGTKG
jgi:PRTRC genetic system protein C